MRYTYQLANFRIRFLHETGLALFYGLIIGAIVRYGVNGFREQNIMKVKPLSASELKNVTDKGVPGKMSLPATSVIDLNFFGLMFQMYYGWKSLQFTTNRPWTNCSTKPLPTASKEKFETLAAGLSKKPHLTRKSSSTFYCPRLFSMLGIA